MGPASHRAEADEAIQDEVDRTNSADSPLDRLAGIDTPSFSSEREERVVLRALAVGFSLTQSTGLIAAFVLAASGLWFAGILVAVAVQMPRVIASGYARRRGVDLFWQSGQARNETSARSLLIGLVTMMIIAGLIAFNAHTGHPLLTWTWRVEFTDFDAVIFSPIVGAAIGIAIGWVFRRRKYRRMQAQSG